MLALPRFTYSHISATVMFLVARESCRDLELMKKTPKPVSTRKEAWNLHPRDRSYY